MSLVSFYLDSSPSVYKIEGLEISHSDFSQTYFIQKSVDQTLTLGISTSQYEPEDFIYVPMAIKPLRASSDLESGITVSLGDVGEFIAKEIDNVISGDGFSEKPVVKYRIWTSDDLDEQKLGPEIYEISKINFSREGAEFVATARQLNLNRTGERYTISRFPMLAGFL